MREPLPMQVTVDLDRLADLIADRVAERLLALGGGVGREAAWLTTREAAEYLGMTVNALHRLTAERRVPFSQDRPGAKCWFRRSDLDAYRERDRRGPR
jgi:excisionase family DNA binding protein